MKFYHFLILKICCHNENKVSKMVTVQFSHFKNQYLNSENKLSKMITIKFVIFILHLTYYSLVFVLMYFCWKLDRRLKRPRFSRVSWSSLSFTMASGTRFLKKKSK